MTAGLITGAGLLSLGSAEGGSRIPFSLPDPAGSFLAVAKLRDLDLRQGNTDKILSFLADHFSAADVLAEIALHLAADDFAEALVIALDLLTHGPLSLSLVSRLIYRPLTIYCAPPTF